MQKHSKVIEKLKEMLYFETNLKKKVAGLETGAIGRTAFVDSVEVLEGWKVWGGHEVESGSGCLMGWK